MMSHGEAMHTREQKVYFISILLFIFMLPKKDVLKVRRHSVLLAAVQLCVFVFVIFDNSDRRVCIARALYAYIFNGAFVPKSFERHKCCQHSMWEAIIEISAENCFAAKLSRSLDWMGMF